MRTTKLLMLACLTGELLLHATTGLSASVFGDLRKEYPDLARLLTLAAPKSGLSKEQLDKAFDNIANWALESKSQQVQDSIELLVDKGRPDYLETMRESAWKIKLDGDASDWPDWLCLWRASDRGGGACGHISFYHFTVLPASDQVSPPTLCRPAKGSLPAHAHW
ncbi:MAG: hypothetical protein HY318_09075 [Armatimonadetes bacterium]|nr:hypothetical protein [Armatimonadota bacterium]